MRSRTERCESSLFFPLSSVLAQAISLSLRDLRKPMDPLHMLRKGQRMGQRVGADIFPAAEYSTFLPESLAAQPEMGKGTIICGVG